VRRTTCRASTMKAGPVTNALTMKRGAMIAEFQKAGRPRPE